MLNTGKVRTLSIQNIALIGMMTATIEVAKCALAFLPNVELVSFFMILYTLFFGRLMFFVIPVFILLEGCIYGFGLWWIMYLYVWPLLVLLVLLLRRQESVLFWSILSGLFGLFFGALSAIPYLFLSGLHGAIAWWVAGIPFDIIHCISNFFICLVLFSPMSRLMKRLRNHFS